MHWWRRVDMCACVRVLMWAATELLAAVAPGSAE
jgi:hypothetical protein